MYECTGPGQVQHLEEFNLTLNSACIWWQKPYICHSGTDSFLYHVTVEGITLNNTLSSAITTDEMHHCFHIDPCGSYTVNVTPSVESYNGTMTSIPVRGLHGKLHTVIVYVQSYISVNMYSKYCININHVVW